MNYEFRKKPIVIEAFQMTPDRRWERDAWPAWLWQAVLQGSVVPTAHGTPDETLSVKTPEGLMLISWGDWIIRGVKGELYPCKPDIFEATYEAVVVPPSVASGGAA